jgi:hypothetical protein
MSGNQRGPSGNQRRQAEQRRAFQKRRARRAARQAIIPAHKESWSARLDWLLGDGSIFAQVKFHGNTSWLPASLVKLALIWSWSECKHLTDAFAEAVGGCEKMLGGSALGTYQGFLGALTRWTPTFIPLLCLVLQQRMREIGGAFWQIAGFVPIGVDGSRSTAPSTTSNEEAFCARHYGQGQTARYRKKKSTGQRRQRNKANPSRPQEPQAWITLLWHLGLRLPWLWRLGPSNSSERAHAMDMLQSGNFPENTLFVGDAGFVGYPFWSAILGAGQNFLVRVGANVRLLREQSDYSLEKDGLVLCWPKAVQPAQPPLRLRLVKIRLGKTEMWMLTSVLNQRLLSETQIIKFYRLRWGIEVEFRGLKQTLDRAKLRSRNSARLLAELDWSILAMAVAELFALREQLPTKPPRPCQTPRRCAIAGGHRAAESQPHPHRRSLANTIRALRQCLRHLDEPPATGQDLATLLRLAVTDRYHRTSSKKSRHYRPNPDKKPLGNPKLRKLTPTERKQLAQQSFQHPA